MRTHHKIVAAVIAVTCCTSATAPVALAAPIAPSYHSTLSEQAGMTVDQQAYAAELGIPTSMIDEAAQLSDAEADAILHSVSLQLARAYEEADATATRDRNGNVRHIDYGRLAATYGSDPHLAAVVAEVNDQLATPQPPRQGIRGVDQFTECFMVEALNGLGADIIKAMWGENVRDAIMRHSWGKVASLALGNLERKLGKKVAAKVAKFVASKFLPSGPVVGLAWVTAKCAWKQF